MEYQKEQDEEYIEVMYNSVYGGFNFSDQAIILYCEQMGIEYESIDRSFVIKMSRKIKRHDKLMILIVKSLGSEANGKYCDIKIEKILARYKDTYEIEEYDGLESVNENHYEYEIQSKNKKLEKENFLLKKRIEELEILLEKFQK